MKKQDKLVGKFGIERYLNEDLQETDGKLAYDSDSWGFLLPNSKANVIAPDNGKNVTLTIDKKIQTVLEDSLNKVQMKNMIQHKSLQSFLIRKQVKS